MASSSHKFMKPKEEGFSDWIEQIRDMESDTDEDVDDKNENYESDHASDSELEMSYNEDEVSQSIEESGVDLLRNEEEFMKHQLMEESTRRGSDRWDTSDEEPLSEVRKYLKKGAFYGRNRFKWSKRPPKQNVRTRKHNIIIHAPGVIGPAKELGAFCTNESAWACFVDQEILECIVKYTNQKLQKVRQNHVLDSRSYRDTDLEEIKAFIALLSLTAIFKSNHEDLDSLFSTDGFGRDIFRSTMSAKRFATLLICLRLDDAVTREERKKEDITAPISQIFSKFVANCQKNYLISEYACIDEMLVGFRGRCKFRMYLPNKPRKYGIKIMALVDAKTHYLYNMYIYFGKESDGIGLTSEERLLPKPTQSVLRLVKPIENTHRNVTADNWFSSIPLVDELLKRGLTYVGTMRKNKKHIPSDFLPSRTREEKSSIFGFTADKTLVSYVPKKNRSVILVSSMHHSNEVDKDTGKPEIILFYNSTKGGVDALDEKCTIYSSNRRCRRWPMVIFFTLLNISLVNAHVIFDAFQGNSSTTRYNFIKNLAQTLMEPHLKKRLANSRIPREIRQKIGNILNEPVPAAERIMLTSRKRCLRCPRSKDRKTLKVCHECNTPICSECAKWLCENCP